MQEVSHRTNDSGEEKVLVWTHTKNHVTDNQWSNKDSWSNSDLSSGTPISQGTIDDAGHSQDLQMVVSGEKDPKHQNHKSYMIVFVVDVCNHSHDCFLDVYFWQPVEVYIFL